ncbi:MAG: hypothetical protein GDA56_25980 [Hormoscilla sp. GM7CHS1pb]|nr:hypothetical protein [Hormoscilla sp. GM7CHS1pb]
MFLSRTRKTIAPFLLATLLLVTSCVAAPPQAPSRSTQQPPTAQSRTSAGQPVAGGQLNKFFPASAGGFSRVFTQEKKGFAQANLKKDSKILALLSISDTANNPSAVSKFNSSSKRIAGYPAATVGSTKTSILVADRFQVSVQSRDSSFTASDREDWLTKFNLSGLARLR